MHTLGLDLGPNSIGWALVDYDDSTNRPLGLVDAGVRIFQEAVDPKTRVPKNQQRRAARAARRLLARRKRRRLKLFNLLLRSGLLPQQARTNQELESLFNSLGDPYLLRKKGLDQPLTLYEFGRVLVHLCHRRGFLSNRKAASKEDGKVKAAITELDRQIMDAKCRTLGEYLAGLEKKRCRYTSRAMYEREFELLWKSQQGFHPESLGPTLKAAIYNTIFHQRPLKLQKFLVGKCAFEPKRRRAARAWPEAQRFRMLQDINHLQIKNPVTRAYRPLRGEERLRLVEKLSNQQTLTWESARKQLGLHSGEKFNIEEGRKSELLGDRTSYRLRKAIGSRWDGMSMNERNALVTDLLTIENEGPLIRRAVTEWGFDNETAEALATLELEPGYMRLSLKAIRRILPYLEQGMTYDKACAAAGYDHSANNSPVSGNLDLPPRLRNPVVQRAMHESRKVVNALVRKYGKPAKIRVEMARDMKLTRKQREQVQREQKQNEQRRKQAREIIRHEFGIPEPSRDDIQKYLLWQECGEICVYTGKSISREMLFSGDVDIEHILPYSQSLDDSYMNKTLCLAEENRRIKHNRSPFEAYGADEHRYAEILLRAQRLPWPKRRRFEQKETKTEEFVTRQLNDTRYICREVKDYLKQLGAEVEVSKGQATAALRQKWNLNRILSSSASGEKNRADHRHHAVDAVVIALTDRSLFHKLSRLSAQSGAALSQRGFELDDPWREFHRDIEKRVRDMIVSHAPSRKIVDALHEDTIYGYSERDKCFVYRKPLSAITVNEISKIRDKKVKELVERRLEDTGGDLKRAFGNAQNPLLHLDRKTPIHSVRLAIDFDQNTMHGVERRHGVPYKFVKFGNNHHVEIVERLESGKRDCCFVTAFEAARRARRDRESIVRRDHGPETRFVMSLCINDIVEVDKNGSPTLYRIQNMSSGKQMEIVLKELNDAHTERNQQTLRLRNPEATRCMVRKLAVDPIGGLSSCND